MADTALEIFLARLYVDAEMRGRFLRDPRGEAERAGLSESDRAAVLQIDRVGLRLAARSFAHKREKKRDGEGSGLLRRLRRWISPR